MIKEIIDVTSQEIADGAIEVLERKLDPRWIKTRQGRGNMQLDYIEGHRVIRLLNEAFGYKWSFQILSQETFTPERGRPFIEVTGRLIIPGIGIKDAYGTKEIIGDASQCSKAAATDCLKKAASMVGIGLELWDDDIIYDDEYVQAPQQTPQQAPQQQAPQQQATQQAPPQTVSTAQPQQQSNGKTWAVPEVAQAASQLTKHKRTLGIRDNEELNPYVEEWSKGQLVSWRDITPTNIQEFNGWLESTKIQALSA